MVQSLVYANPCEQEAFSHSDINAKDHVGNTALLRASISGNVEAIKLLLERGADIEAQNNMGKTALMIASNSGNVKSYQTAIGKGS